MDLSVTIDRAKNGYTVRHWEQASGQYIIYVFLTLADTVDYVESICSKEGK